MSPIKSRKEIVFLIVEPAETALSTRKLLVESEGFNAVSAISATQALSFFERYDFSAVIYDLEANDVPAAEFLQRIRNTSPDTPVFAVAPNGWVPEGLRSDFSGIFERMTDPAQMVGELVIRFGQAAQSAA